jgi:aspartate aminotransferase
MSIKLSQRVSTIKPSPTLAVTARAAEMRAAGQDIIGLGAGEPDFDTPEHIKQAAIQAIHDGFTKYTDVAGTPQLKQAVADKFKRENGFDYKPAQILVSCGGKQSFFNLAQALLNPGDEVIIPEPYWVSYPDMCLLAGADPVYIQTGPTQRYKIARSNCAPPSATTPACSSSIAPPTLPAWPTAGKNWSPSANYCSNTPA